MTEKEMEAKITQAHIDGYNRGFAKAKDKIADIKANCDYVLEGKEIEHREERNKLCADFENMKATLESKIAELEKHNGELIALIHAERERQEKCDDVHLRKIAELEKENAELKEQGDKWFVFETDAGNWGMDKATQYTVDRHNYFYGTKEECQKWGVEHKIKDYTGHKYCYDRLEEQLAKAKEIIKDLIDLGKIWLSEEDDDYSFIEQAEQFLKEIEK